MTASREEQTIEKVTRLDWVQPEIRRLHAADAETGDVVVSDGVATQS